MLETGRPAMLILFLVRAVRIFLFPAWECTRGRGEFLSPHRGRQLRLVSTVIIGTVELPFSLSPSLSLVLARDYDKGLFSFLQVPETPVASNLPQSCSGVRGEGLLILAVFCFSPPPEAKRLPEWFFMVCFSPARRRRRPSGPPVYPATAPPLFYTIRTFRPQRFG